MDVMATLLGVPHEDVGSLARWTEALSRTYGIMSPEEVEDASDAIVGLLAYMEQLTERRREDPGDDLISTLLAVEDEGDRLDHRELLDMVANLLVGGHDTTASQIGCTLLTMLRHPDAVARLRSEPDLLASAVAETIRFEPSIGVVPRTAIESMTVADVEVDVGAAILLSTAAANREPGIWPDPDRLEVDRFTRPEVPRLLSFGAGVHYCLGAALARLTVEEVLRAFVAVKPGLELAPGAHDVEWRSILGRSPARLPVVVA
jgi:cytochrome P450